MPRIFLSFYRACPLFSTNFSTIFRIERSIPLIYTISSVSVVRSADPNVLTRYVYDPYRRIVDEICFSPSTEIGTDLAFIYERVRAPSSFPFFPPFVSVFAHRAHKRGRGALEGTATGRKEGFLPWLLRLPVVDGGSP